MHSNDGVAQDVVTQVYASLVEGVALHGISASFRAGVVVGSGRHRSLWHRLVGIQGIIHITKEVKRSAMCWAVLTFTAIRGDRLHIVENDDGTGVCDQVSTYKIIPIALPDRNITFAA